MSRLKGIFDIISTDQCLILSIFVATDVSALFTKSEKNCNLKVWEEGMGSGTGRWSTFF